MQDDKWMDREDVEAEKPIPKHIMGDLQEYLLSHEIDIAAGINDFGSLVRSFDSIIGRMPIEG